VALVVAVTLGTGVTNSSPALAKQPCTKTAFGECIKGGDRCAKARYGMRGLDAAGKRWICKGSRTNPYWMRSRCAKLLDRAFQLEPTSNPQINPLLDFMGDRCPAHYEVFTDYVSVKGMAEQFGRDKCTDLLQYRIHRIAIAYLREDGYCTRSGWSSREVAPRSTAISWREAGSHVGTNQRVCGPLVGTGSSTDDVFWNLGRNYPDPGRFTIVLWDVGSADAPPLGRTLCVTGRITSYRGVPQIELRSASQVDVE
jgi:hypothetical protein